MKQTKLWLTTIVMLLGSITASAHDFIVDGIYYGITSSTTVAVTYRGNYSDSYNNEYSGAVTIPSTVTYNSKTYSVTSIGSSAFYGCSSLTAITIPEGVTSIGSSAFSGCSSLYKVINYSNLSLSTGSSNYGYVAYYAKLIIKGSELTTIGDFQFCTSNGVHYLVNYIGKETSITLPNDYNGANYDIRTCAFYGCSSLTSITIPASVTSIGGSAFENCSSLTAINIPEGVKSIGSSAFYGCSSLTAITIPEGVKSIGNYAFDNCTALKKVIFEDGSETLSLGYNYYYSSSTGQGLFYDCPLESVYLGRNLSYSSGSSYGYSPFYNKDALVHVMIGREVTAINNNAFKGCDNIHSLTINSGVLSIGSSAFSTPDKVIWLTNTPPTGYANANGNINYVANNQYTSLSNVKVYPYLSSMFEVDGVKYVPVSPSERTCHAIDCTYDSTAEIINVSETTSFKGVAMKVTEVMPYTFYENNHIKEVAMSHLGNIGNYAFYNCDSIKTVNVSNQGNIGSQAFYNCDAIESVTISNQGDIGEQAFYDCNGIRTTCR